MDNDPTTQGSQRSDSTEPILHEQNRELLGTVIEQEWQNLLPGIRIYVKRFDLADDFSSIDAMAREVLQDTVATALARNSNYDRQRLPLPWLLGIAINHIRHRCRARGRVVAIHDVQLPGKNADNNSRSLSSDEMFDLLQYANTKSGTNRITVDELLSLVDEDDQQVLRLAFIEGLRGKDLAARMGIGEGAAWARTSRSLSRLRRAYFESEEEKGKKD
jgi:RNA polymerase sigma factor (sigma-70 family)